MSSDRPVAAIAPAKVNLWLEVLGRRGDGYHEIRTWMLAIDLADRIEARASEVPGIRLEIRGDGAAALPAGRGNLAWKGAEARIEAAPPGPGVDLVLEKRIPSQAGLGGGSSDAAGAWVATAGALGLDLDPAAGRERLAALGSDCPFFLDASATGAGLCTGRGEVVEERPAPRAGWWIALASPDVVCPTAQVYAALRRIERGAERVPELPADWADLAASEVRPFSFNRLEAAALEAVPRLRAWRETLDAAGRGLWHLSGSGSSYFALCDSRAEAEDALARLRRASISSGVPVRGAWVARPAGHGAKETELS